MQCTMTSTIIVQCTMPPLNLRARDSRGKRPPDTEAEVVEPDERGDPVAGGRAEDVWKVDPGTAAKDTAKPNDYG